MFQGKKHTLLYLKGDHAMKFTFNTVFVKKILLSILSKAFCKKETQAKHCGLI